MNSGEFIPLIKMVSLAESQSLIQLIDEAAEIDSKLLDYIYRTHRIILELSGDEDSSDSVDESVNTVIQVLKDNEGEFSESFLGILDEIRSRVESHLGLESLNCILNELTDHAMKRATTLRQLIEDLIQSSTEIISHKELAMILDRIVTNIQSIDSYIRISLYRMKSILDPTDE